MRDLGPYIDSYQGTMLDGAAVKYLVIHYSATPIEMDYSSKIIDAMHRERGFNEIGYHYFIRKNGAVETGRSLTQAGRFEQGAHAKGHNHASIGICYEGGVRANDVTTGFDTRTIQQIASMIALLKDLQSLFPGSIVIGHRDLPGAATQCPGFDAGAWWAGVKALNNPNPVQAPVNIFTALFAFIAKILNQKAASK